MPQLRPGVRRDSPIGDGEHLGALLEGHHVALGADRIDERGIAQAGTGADVQHDLAGFKRQKGNGRHAQWHGESGRVVVSGGTVSIQADRLFVVRLLRHDQARDDQARDALCRPSTPITMRAVLPSLMALAGSLKYR